MSGPQLLFVEVSSTGKVHDKKARQAIQKHVMRDTAAERRRQSKLKREKNQDREDILSWTKNSTKQNLPPVNRSHPPETFLPSLTLYPSPALGGGRLDPFDQYPIKMDLEKLSLIDYVYTSPLASLRPFRETWLPLSKSDPAFFYEVLSHISQVIASLRPGDPDYLQSLRYHSLAIQSVNKRLADPEEGTSDGIIGTILAFASFGVSASHSKQDFSSYASHMEGLMTIIKIRGGVHKIDHNRILRILLAGASHPTTPRRFLVDVVTACFLGILPCFTAPPLPTLASQVPSSEKPLPTSPASKIWDPSFPLFPNTKNFGDLFTSLSITIMTIKSALSTGRPLDLWHDPTFLTDHVDPLIHRYVSAETPVLDILLTTTTLSPTNNSTKELRRENTRFAEQTVVVEGCRLGALILLRKVRRRFLSVQDGSHGRQTKTESTGVETSRLKVLLETYGERWKVMKPLLLWAVVLGGMETLESEGGEGKWFVGRIGQIMEEMGLRRWMEVVGRVNGLLWVGEVLDVECAEVGRRVMLLF